MRALTMDELEWVSGGQDTPPPSETVVVVGKRLNTSGSYYPNVTMSAEDYCNLLSADFNSKLAEIIDDEKLIGQAETLGGVGAAVAGAATGGVGAGLVLIGAGTVVVMTQGELSRDKKQAQYYRRLADQYGCRMSG